MPFALIGVLLLVSSAAFAAALGTSPSDSTPTVDRAMDGAAAETTTTLRASADDAATETVGSPVIEPANTTAGRALSDDRSFRDALKLRLYLYAHTRLDAVEVRRGEVTATASLPSIEPTEAGHRDAIDRVHLERTGEDGAALHVEIENVTLTATRDGRPIERVERTPEFVVANPALLLHDRTERFETRLDAPVTEPGLGRELTARLYPVAWARGYAQYGGAPIETVIGTRHVELATNDALVAEQRETFGVADPGGERGVAAAGRRVATTDLLVGAGGDDQWTDAVLDAADDLSHDAPDDPPIGSRTQADEARKLTVGVNRSADRAFANVVGIEGDDELETTIERAHTVEAELSVRVDRRERHTDADDRPAGGWELLDTASATDVSLAESSGTTPSRDGWERKTARQYEATVTERTTRTWSLDNRTRTTNRTTTSRYDVRVGLFARTAPIDGVPAGALDGSLAGATERATASVVDDSGGFRSAAEAAARDGETTYRSEAVSTPTLDRDDAEAELRAVRERTRNVSVTQSAPAIGAGRANPPEALRDRLDEKRSLPRDSGIRRSTEARTRIAVQFAYFDALDAELAAQASTHEDANDGIEAAVGERLDPSRLDGALESHRAATRSEPEPVADPAGNVSLTVDAGPSYLPTGAVHRDRIDVPGGGTVYPLTTRNINLFTSPHGQVATSIFDRIPFLGTERVALSTAAQTLRSADAGRDVGLEFDRDELRSGVSAATASVNNELVVTLVDEGVRPDEARRIVEADDGTSTADTALALTNGTAVDRIVSDVVESDDYTANERDRLRVRLELTTEDALADDAARPPLSMTSETAERVRDGFRDELEAVAEEGLEEGTEHARKRVLGENMGSLPAGLPLAPVPGYWYATANVWYVETAGQYERFAVRTNRGGSTGNTTYVRDGRTAWLDHGGDRIRLGTADRISFRTETAVVVVVPPGGRGVGDTDGVVDERSSGWPP